MFGIPKFGLSAGNVVQLAGIALGLSAILVSSTIAFDVVKYLGAAYLVYLGVRRVMERDGPRSAGGPGSTGPGGMFLQGAVINLLNPKTAVFAFAFLPQFVAPAADNPTLQLFVLGLLFNLLSVVVGICYALLGGVLGD